MERNCPVKEGDSIVRGMIRSEGYDEGLEKAWSLAKKIGAMRREERRKIFGCEFPVEECTVSDALGKMRAYEKTLLREGDEVVFRMDEQEFRAAVLGRAGDRDGVWYILTENGVERKHEDFLVKTGRRFSEIGDLVEELKKPDG